MASNESKIVSITQLLRIRRFVSNKSQAGDAASLLIDRDDGLDHTQVAQIID